MKKCINCSNELFDEAVICPKCKTEQPVTVPIYLPTEKVMNKSKKSKAYIKAIIAVLASLVVVILIAAVCLCGYQVKRAAYINAELDTWIADIEKGDFNDIRESIDEYNIEKIFENNDFLSSVWNTLFPDNMESVTKLFCKDWNTYKDVYSLYGDLELINTCYESYQKWLDGEIDKASESDVLLYSVICIGESLSEISGESSVTDENLCKYDWFEPYYEKLMQFTPTADNVSGYVYAYDSYGSDSDCATVTIKNNNFFPIRVSDIQAEVNITLMMIPTYGNPDYLRINDEPIDLNNAVSNGDGDDISLIYGGESVSYEFDMNIEDRYYLSYISYILYDSSVVITQIDE